LINLRKLLHGVGWTVVDIVEDYGEDFLARIFDNGNPTGNDLYIRLKSTKNMGQYALGLGIVTESKPSTCSECFSAYVAQDNT
jgi:hypothetical protein